MDGRICKVFVSSTYVDLPDPMSFLPAMVRSVPSGS